MEKITLRFLLYFLDLTLKGGLFRNRISALGRVLYRMQIFCIRIHPLILMKPFSLLQLALGSNLQEKCLGRPASRKTCLRNYLALFPAYLKQKSNYLV